MFTKRKVVHFSGLLIARIEPNVQATPPLFSNFQTEISRYTVRPILATPDKAVYTGRVRYRDVISRSGSNLQHSGLTCFL